MHWPSQPTLPGMNGKKRIAKLLGLPCAELRIVLVTTIRSVPAASIACSTVSIFREGKADGSWLAGVTPRAAIRSGRERTMAVQPTPSDFQDHFYLDPFCQPSSEKNVHWFTVSRSFGFDAS